MNADQFCFWLQGFFELTTASTKAPQPAPPITQDQAEMIRRHLETVFVKVTTTPPPFTIGSYPSRSWAPGGIVPLCQPGATTGVLDILTC